MNALITYDDFIDDVMLDMPDANQVAFNTFLIKMQTEYLRKSLGVQLYNLLDSGYSEDPIPTIWTNLINGCDFTYSDIQYRFEGLKSGLIYYSYVKYLQNNMITQTITGTIKPLNENSENITPIGHINNAINYCVELNNDLEAFIKVNETDYPNYIYSNIYSNYANILGI